MPTLLFENGPDRGSGVELEPGKTYTLGRDPRADIVVRDDLVSRSHCRVKEFKGAWYIKDAGSSNGVWVNDVSVDQGELKFGDQVRLGNMLLSFLGEGLEQVRRETTLGGYRLQQRLGRGGMGTVFKALQISLGREVALKVLSPHLVRDPKFVDLFQREARAAGQLNHPHIVQVYDVGQEGDQYFYSMEYIEGGSLEDRLQQHEKLEASEVIGILEQAALALEYAESRHIVHRDIKPDNLMITADGRVKIADLGLALSVVEDKGGHTGQPILGTPHFLSPEQALRREVDTRSDIYALGATAYRMLTGRTLFEGSSAEEIIKKQVREEPRPLRELEPSVPEKLSVVIRRMLQKDPDDRFESATELREALHHLSRKRGRTVALWSAVGVAVVAIGLSTYLAIRGPEKVIVQQADSADRAEKFRALDKLEQTEIELNAVRAYLDIAVGSRFANAQSEKESLEAWLEINQGYPFPELDLARARVAAIDAEVRAAQEREQRIVEERERKIDRAEKGVAVELEARRYLDAHRIAASMDVSDPEESGAGLLESTRDRLTDRVVEAAAKSFEEARSLVEAAVTESDFGTALAAIAELETAFPLVDESVQTEFAETLRGYQRWFPDRRAAIRSVEEKSKATARRQDLRRIVDGFDGTLSRHLLELDLEAAATHLESLAEATSHPAYRALVEPVAQSTRQSAVLFERALQKIERGESFESKLRWDGRDRDAVLESCDRQQRTVTVREEFGGGSKTVAEPFSSFASAEGFEQLVVENTAVTPEEKLAALETCVLLQVARWARPLDALKAGVRGYDPEQGWIALEPMPKERTTGVEMALGGALRTLGREHPEHADAVASLRGRIEREVLCHDVLLRAVAPFFQGGNTVSWVESKRELDSLFEVHRNSLLLRMVYPLIHADYDFPLVDN